MSFFNEKWNRSSVVTKVPAFVMLLDALLLLACAIVFFSLGGYVSEAIAYGIAFLVVFLYNSLISFGLFKVNRLARIAAIIGGLGIALPFILYAILFIVSLINFPILKTALTVYGELLKSILPTIMSLVPAEMKGLLAFLLIIFIGPMVLNVIAMLVLFFCGEDFKSGTVKSRLVAYLLWLFLGFFSAHKFYLEKDGSGILYFLTFQIFTLGWFANLFTLGKQVDAYNAKLGTSQTTATNSQAS
ncbi:MAG: TM2 domain-containing protein [Treponema sp.]|jgi:TM2 domain-containing membrane protein YozV|nr:TM2 domain-containing protein [Treponema sp.]